MKPAFDFAETDLLVESVRAALLTLAEGLHVFPLAIKSPPFYLGFKQLF